MQKKGGLYKLNSENRDEYHRQYYLENKEKIRIQQLEYGKTIDGKDARRRAKIKQLENTKYVVFDHYCGKKWYCMCKKCNESNKILLTVDHVKNNGKKHREEIGNDSIKLYRYIIENKFPEDFQILCYNCNIGKYRNGGICPHNSQINDWEWEL